MWLLPTDAQGHEWPAWWPHGYPQNPKGSNFPHPGYCVALRPALQVTPIKDFWLAPRAGSQRVLIASEPWALERDEGEARLEPLPRVSEGRGSNQPKATDSF